jgi:glutamine synthetase
MRLECSSPSDVMSAIEEHGVQIVDVKFTDLYGQWQHFSMPVEEFEAEAAFEEGMGFDGSSIRGFQSIENSDMVLRADPTTAMIDPICEHTTLSLICNVFEPLSGVAYTRDPRYVLQKSIQYLEDSGIADTAYFGPEAEFFIFDRVKYETGRYYAGYAVDSEEAPWNSGEWGLGHTSNYKGGYYPVAPFDTLQDLRSEMVRTMIDAGIDIEVHHHEVATAGQVEIDMKFKPVLKMADQVQLYKYVAKNVAKAYGKTVTLCPSHSLKIMAPVCTPTRACGRMASHSLLAMNMLA